MPRPAARRARLSSRQRTRQRDPEARAQPRFAAHADLAAHEFGQALDDRQPEARAAVMAGGGGIDLREGS